MANNDASLYNLRYNEISAALEAQNGPNWIELSVGGGGTPSAPDTSVQFNNMGAFGGSADLTWSGSVLTVNGGIVADQVSNPGSLDISADSGDLTLGSPAGNIFLTSDPDGITLSSRDVIELKADNHTKITTVDGTSGFDFIPGNDGTFTQVKTSGDQIFLDYYLGNGTTLIGETRMDTNATVITTQGDRFLRFIANENGTDREWDFLTDGQMKCPGVAGDPASPVEGAIWYDTTGNRFRGYDGTHKFTFDVTND